MFYGRTNELNELEEIYKSDRKQFVVIYGKRRIGKTELINTFCEGKEGIYYQAHFGDGESNLSAFSRKVSSLISNNYGGIFTSWDDAFRTIDSFYINRRYYLVIDEYPFIAGNFVEFPSILQAFYDHASDNLFLVIMGSDISFLKKELMDNNSPLYMRRTYERQLKKMKFSEALLFLEGLSVDDKCNYLSLMSSYPFYLNSVNKSLDFEDSVKNLLFRESGEFARLPDALMYNAHDIQMVYDRILLSIIHNHHTVDDISANIRMETSELSEYLRTMTVSEIIEEREDFEDRRHNCYYVISDPMLRFWYTFVYPNKKLIHANGTAVYESERENIHGFLCHAFEDTAKLYIEELNAKGELQKIFPPLQRFEIGYSKQLGRAVELDGLSQSGDTLLVVECKYTNKPFSQKRMEHLRESASVFGKKMNRQFYIFSKAGFAYDLDITDDIHCFTVEDMLKAGD